MDARSPAATFIIDLLSAVGLKSARMKRFFFAIGLSSLAVSASILLSACGGRPAFDPNALSWIDFAEKLTNSADLARLDAPPSGLLTSYDPAGSNDDFNHYVRKGPKGWIVLADLTGPGYISRFWFTGADDGKQRFRFYFDGEREPSLELTLDDLTGGRAPFLPPLAIYENFCWYSYIPIPYAKRLVVMTQEGGYKEGGWPRLFYQINYSTLPKDTKVNRFSCDVTEAQKARLQALLDAWSRGAIPGDASGLKTASQTIELAPGESKAVADVAGPAVIRRLSVTPEFAKIASAVDREQVLRDVAVQIAWDGSAAASVNVPLGDFFGSVWRRTRYNSMYFGLTNDTFSSRFPMPFRKSATCRFQNQGRQAVTLQVEVAWEPLAAWDAGLGYFHAAWSRSGPGDVGKPHAILRTKGRGRFAGCLLDVLSLDRSWWLLEGDEITYRDGETVPSMHGTGLEDYFNAGWYYQNVLGRPLAGLGFKAFFRTSQYRLHLPDPVLFNSSFSMTFERGPNHASHGWMESVAYYYLEAPVAAAFALPPAEQRGAPRDPLAEATVMTELANCERFGDYRGARDYIDQFLETYREFPFAPVLRLRQIAYREAMEGFAAAKPLYEQFVASETNAAAVEQAKLILWYNEDPSRALLSLFCNFRAKAFLDGREICANEKPERIAVVGLTVAPGRHGIAVQSAFQTYPSWIQASLQTHTTQIVTRTDWRYAFNPRGEWAVSGFDDAAWKPMGGTGCKGPPEEPYVWIEPNAFVNTQARGAGLRAPDAEWPSQASTLVFRKDIDVP